MIMHIVLVEHQKGGKKFVFDCTNLKDFVKAGDTVICETMYGEQTGIAVTSPVLIKGSQGYIASLLKMVGAYFPIKRVIGIQRSEKLTEADKERIAKEWLRERLGSDELPF